MPILAGKVFPGKSWSEERFWEAELPEENSNMRKIKQRRDYSQFNSLGLLDKLPIDSKLIWASESSCLIIFTEHLQWLLLWK